jgi:ferredoxin
MNVVVNSQRPAAATDVRVVFEKSAIQAIWTPAHGSLLEFAELQGLEPLFGCRRGTCGACRTAIHEGEIAYERPTKAKHEANEVLICCAVPAQHDDGRENCIRLDL